MLFRFNIVRYAQMAISELEALPDDVFLRIAAYLEIEDVLALRKVRPSTARKT